MASGKNDIEEGLVDDGGFRLKDVLREASHGDAVASLAERLDWLTRHEPALSDPERPRVGPWRLLGELAVDALFEHGGVSASERDRMARSLAKKFRSYLGDSESCEIGAVEVIARVFPHLNLWWLLTGRGTPHGLREDIGPKALNDALKTVSSTVASAVRVFYASHAQPQLSQANWSLIASLFQVAEERAAQEVERVSEEARLRVKWAREPTRRTGPAESASRVMTHRPEEISTGDPTKGSDKPKRRR